MPHKKDSCPQCGNLKKATAKMCINCKRPKKEINHCIQCQSETPNPKFCSRSCAATYNNIKFPKRKPEHKCKNCKTPVTANINFCSNQCRKQFFDWLDPDVHTIKDVRDRRNSQKHSQIRDLSRKKVLNLNIPLSCLVCGYNNHIEVCHIKAIADFPDDTLISVVNSFENLTILCPNHHWEFDNIGLVTPTLPFSD